VTAADSQGLIIECESNITLGNDIVV
jgi:hypothetical protein